LKSDVRPQRRTWMNEVRLTAFLFLLPALLVFGIFVIIPILQSARYSVYEWNGLGPLTNYVALKNYVRMFNDPVFWRALSNNIIVVIWSLITQIPLAIGLAILLTGKLRGSAFFRTLYFAPLVLAEVIVATLWSWIYNPTFGLINTILRNVGLGQFSQFLLANPNLSLFAVLIATNWKYLGFYIVIFIAAIQTIPDELYEAGKIDGASGFQLHRFITLPMLSTTVRTTGVLAIVGSLKFFDLVWVLTEGGPTNGSEVLATYMFKEAFKATDFGYGSALAFALFAVAFVGAMLFILSTQRRSKTG
jgi:raffinose/stachyose/melibiose transport system permease protein